MACVDYPNSNGWFHTVELFFFFCATAWRRRVCSLKIETSCEQITHQTSKTPIRLTQTFFATVAHFCSHARSLRRRTDNTITTSILLIIHLSVTFPSRCSNSRVTVVSTQGNDVVAVIYFDAHSGAFSWQSAPSVRISPPPPSHFESGGFLIFSPPLSRFSSVCL